jgi:GT2 family glycosyltransferase
MADVARLRPDAEFHLCGAVTDPAALALGRLPNVTLHGEIPYADVPGFVQAMDVMTIPFRILPIIEACDPVKFYEYAASGVPAVATPLPELARAGDLVIRAAGPAAFAAALDDAARAGRDPAHAGRLRDYARANTWAARAAAFSDAISVEPPVTAVILHWGKAELTRAAIHSLSARGGAYPNLEILVVDNGPDPWESADLAAYIRGVPHARLLGDGTNRGFAAGNNLAIRESRGDYVLLLNNDTYAAPGAIHAMVAHLARDPSIGVVGPLTNSIGNEARVEVHYADMDQMVRAARRLATGHRGQTTEVRVSAYFCAMFRRADFARFGLLPEIYGRGMFEDDDHCAAIRAAGLRCVIAEDAFVHHHLSASFGTLEGGDRAALFARNRGIYEERWGAWQPHRYRTTRPAATTEAA